MIVIAGSTAIPADYLNWVMPVFVVVWSLVRLR